jgi:histidinol-phosphate aminotransferase
MRKQGPTPRQSLLALRPYKAAAAGRVLPRHNLSANESCLGPSSAAIEAAAAACRNLELYPDGGSTSLRKALGSRFALDPEAIVCGAGSEELISLIVQAYVEPGDEVLFSHHGFIKYELATHAVGAVPIRAPETDFTADSDALIEAVTPRTQILFLANPNNPTGTFVPARDVRRLREELRQDILLVVDAAYAEYISRADYDDGLMLARETSNTLVLRTFSKIYGLAGLRVGWGFGSRALIDTLNKVRGAFNVSAIAQAAATAAIHDLDHESRARQHNDRWLPWLSDRLAGLGLMVVPSVCNFVMVRFTDPATAQAAERALAAQDVLTLRLAGYGLPEALRITVGTAEANEAVIAALAQAGSSASGAFQDSEGAP